MLPLASSFIRRFASITLTPQATPEPPASIPATATLAQRIDGETKIFSANESIGNGRNIVVALPGAFTPVCSSKHIPQFEARAQEFSEKGIDNIYILSINDSFVMKAWADDQRVEKVQLVADSHGEFTRGMNMLGSFGELGVRSLRYAAVVNQGKIEYFGLDEAQGFGVSSPDAIFDYLNKN